MLADLLRTRRDLERTEERVEFLYENAPVMHFTLDAGGRVLSVNEFGATALGYEPDELVGRAVEEVFHPEDRSQARVHVAQCVRELGRVRHWELRKMHRDGRILWVQETVRAIDDGDGIVLLVACQDVTDRKKAEWEMAIHETKLAKLSLEPVLAEERERRRISRALHDTVGHDLALMRMKLDSLRAFGADGAKAWADELRRLVDRCIKSTRSMTFELSSPVLYELGFEPALRDLGEQLLPEHGIRLEFESDGCDRRVPQTTSIIVLRAARELLHNVIKHAEASTVAIRVGVDGAGIAVEIADDGCGFEAAPDGRCPTNGHCGLFGIREQLSVLGGTLDVGPRSPRGTLARIEVPHTL